MDVTEARGHVDFAIVTIREDEFRAILRRFPDKLGDGLARGLRLYNMRALDLGGGDAYTLAILRCIEQGNGEALAATRDLLDDLAPRWVLAVGIASAVPSLELTLGDVVVSTRSLDVSVEALLKDGSFEHAVTGGPVDRDASILAANLPAIDEELGAWNTPESIAAPQPPVDLAAENFYGDDEWKRKVRKSIEHHFMGTPRAPRFTAGAIAVSDRLVKDEERVQRALTAARQVLAIEMESGGLHRAAYGREVSFLAIRGISDVLGFVRDAAWTEYACNSAAAFTRAFLLTRPIPLRAAAGAPDDGPELRTGTGTYVTSVEIHGIRSIDALHWEIPPTAGPGWHVIIGDNGAGKSSFLRSVALALVSETEAHALRQDWNDWLRRGSAEGSVHMILARHYEDSDPVTFDAELKLSRHGEQVKLEDVSPNDPGRRIRDGSSPGLFSAAYGPFRRFSGGDSDYEKLFASLPRLARHLSLFDERPALMEGLAWLKDLRFKQHEKHPDGELLEPIKEFVNQAGFLPHGTRLTDISSAAVTFTDGNGCEVAVEQLSDGHRSILSLTLELLRQLAVTYGPGKVFDPDDPTRVIAPGVVLIDEVDVHLHPTWQRAVGIWFTRHFPRVQFIVTSHSPLVCQAAEVGTVFLLPRPGSTGGRMLAGAELDRLRYGNVLDAYGTGVFGEGVTRSESAKRMLERLAELNGLELERDLSPEEIEEQDRLRTTFPTAAHARSSGAG